MVQIKKHHQTLVFVLFLIILLSLTSKSGSSSSSESSKNRKHHFVLVHGSCHGAWSWYKVITLLKSWGHNVTALDLAASGVNQKQALELKSISEYFEPLTKFMASSVGESQRVVLVGHSLGGLAISHAMEHFPHKISVAVFAAALMPGPMLNISTINQEDQGYKKKRPLLDNYYAYDEGPNKSATRFFFGPNYLATYLYQLSPQQDWNLATTLPPGILPNSLDHAQTWKEGMFSELTAGKVAANLESLRSVMTHCSADRVMLRRHSSSQVLPSGSKRLWCKMFLWSHRNIHRPISSKSTQVNPGVAVTHNPYGYSSDTLEPKHKQSPENVECYNIESLRLECFIKCKGVLRGGAEVAVKRISQENDGVREFLAEISSLGRLKQRNLVALRGWCKKDMGNFLLVYEYMDNGSLDKRVFCDESMMLNCEERIRNIKGVAFAVLYLHEGWEEQVLHRDIKASNVLLDKDMNGKLGDFGLARMHSHGQVASTTKLVGTVGYMAPEVIKTGQASTRTDVYMFGILILEVMCGRRPMEEGKPPLVEFVWGLMVKGELMNALDERLSAKGDFNLQQVEKVLQLGLLCAYPEPKSRPNMRQVVSILEGNNEGGEESENENADTCLLLKLKSGDIFSEYPRDGKLFVNVVSVESGKAIAKSSKGKRRRLLEESVLTATEEGPLSIVSGATDEILAVLKNDAVKNPDKKKEIVKLLNPIPNQVFERLYLK
ncbi:L-type lectin-domain containing receptor kinase VII [Arachis hypogaea]|nr:L-type lectin-domain containing receptor kinase VII [Arachis hypogaea]